MYKKLFKVDEAFIKVLTYKGHLIFDILHSIDRYKERVSNDLTAYYNLLKKGIDYILSHKLENVEEVYIFNSNKYGFGIQVEWRKDRNPKIKTLNGYSATTLSKDEMKFFKKADKKLFLENIAKTEGLKKAKDIVDKGFAFYEFDKELKNELYSIHCDLFIESGEIFCTYKIITF